HAAGVVSSVSVLVNTPGWPDARDRLRAIGGTLGVGLHLNLTTGAPLTTAPSLTTPPPTARFHSLAALVARALTGRLDPAHVSAECAAQLARLREAGVRVTHIDSHRHVHALPGVWGVVIETARREGVPVVRVPLEPPSPRAGDDRADGASGPPGRRPRGLGRLHHAAGRRARRAHVVRGAGAVCERGVSPGALRRAVTNSCHSITSHATRQGIPLMR